MFFVYEESFFFSLLKSLKNQARELDKNVQLQKDFL